MMRPLVKICGITRVEDAELSVDLGASALGFIFYPKSPRFVRPSQAEEILQVLRLKTFWRVGVFVNPSIEALDAVMKEVRLTHLQLHGNESAEFCQQVRLKFPESKIIKAIRLGTLEAKTHYPVDYELLDHSTPSEWGGTGIPVSWKEVKLRQSFYGLSGKPLFLAGGLNSTNVLEAIREASPNGIDLSSGVEDSPGIKSELKLRALFTVLNEIPKTETT